MELTEGLSFLIRAKNEELNVILCLKSLINAVEEFDDIEIIFVDNGSTDSTYELAQKVIDDYNKDANSNAKKNETSKIKIDLYQFNKSVCKVGDNLNKNNVSLTEYYNWCLSKVTKYNIIKWDADFVANYSNLIDLINRYKLNIRSDNFSVWFTGITIFEHNNEYYNKINSYYDEFRIFSKKHGFEWVNAGSICEFAKVNGVKLRYTDPIFYELKRTSIDEFENRKILIDRRDREDYSILSSLKNGDNPPTISKLDNELVNNLFKNI